MENSGRGKKRSKKSKTQESNKGKDKNGGQDRYGNPFMGPGEQEVDQPLRLAPPIWDCGDRNVDVYEPAQGSKRPRAGSFNSDQVQSMKDLADVIGWTLEDPVNNFIVDIFCRCSEISRQEFYNWMRVNGNHFGPGSSGAAGSSNNPPPAPAS